MDHLSPKMQEKKNRHPAVAIRTSSRISRKDGPILEKATKRVQEKDELFGGNKNVNPFTVLNFVPNSHFHNVMKDLDIEVVEVDTQIESVRAEEIVRAKLADANYRNFLEKNLAKSAPQGEEDLADLTMEIIDNASRVLSGT